VAIDAADHWATAMSARASANTSSLSATYGPAAALLRAASARPFKSRSSTQSPSPFATSHWAASLTRFDATSPPPLLAFTARS
jgi:hypothetical protein